MKALIPVSVLSAAELDRLVRLLRALPAHHRWAVEHRHGPLLCALSVIEAPDAGYAHAAGRRFSDAAELRQRALALLDELTRDYELAAQRRVTPLRLFWPRRRVH